MSEAPALELVGIVRRFKQADAPLEVLRGASLAIRAGEAVALVGQSGAGKSTLLHIAGLLEQPDSGDVVLAGQPCSKMGDGERTAMRRKYLGFVYQFHHLLPEFSAIVRAIANAPRVLLADEPTGNLDPHTADGVFMELMKLVRSTGLAALIATHNPELAARMDRVVTIREGKIVPV